MTNLDETVTAAFSNTTGAKLEMDDECAYYPQNYLTEKFILIAIFGTLISVVAFCNNCLLIHVLIRSPLIRTHVFYLCVLAVCDIVAEISYILTMSGQILFDYFAILSLYRLWHNYVRSIFALTNVALTLAAYMIVSASAERYLSTLSWLKHRTCTRRDRWLVVFGVFCFAFVSKGTVFWEIEVVYNENCTGFGEYHVRTSALARDPVYKVGYALWFRHIAHVFFPFFLLLFLNGCILMHLKKNPMEMHSALISLTLGDLARQRKKSIRAATMMLGGIVTTYLISNLLNVIITIWEHVDKDNLEKALNGRFYTFAADTITLLTIVTGCIRLPIYCACNKQLRQEIFRLVSKWRLVAGSCKRLFGKARENNNDSNFVNLCENGTITTKELPHGNITEQHSTITPDEDEECARITVSDSCTDWPDHNHS